MTNPDDTDDIADLDAGSSPATPTAQPGGRTYSAEEVSAIVQKRLDKDRSSRGARPRQAGPDAATIARRALAFAASGYSPEEAEGYAADLSIAMPAPPPRGAPRSAPPPAQPPGSAPARVITADTPMWQLSREDLSKLAKQIGPFEFKKRLLGQLAETGQRFKLSR